MKKTVCMMSALIAGTMLAFADPVVIYQDDFTRDASLHPGGHLQVLKTRTPYNKTTGGQWWKAQWNSGSSSFEVRGAEFVRSPTEAGLRRGAFLDFTPESGFIYTLSVDMTVANATGGSGFLAMGFSANTLHIDDYESAQAAWDAGKDTSYVGPGSEYTDTVQSAWGGWRLNLQNEASTFKDVGYGGMMAGGTPTAGYNTYQVILDTTGENWAIEWVLNGESIRTEEVETNPTVRNVFLASDDLQAGGFDNFSLTVIPEPATIGMLGLSAVGLSLLRRLRG